MSYVFYFKQPLEMLELKLNMLLDETPQLINSLDGSVNHPFIREYSIKPFI